MPILGEDAPGSPWVGRFAGDTEVRQVDTSCVQESGHVVVVRDEETGRVGERGILGEPSDGDVPVRGDDRGALYSQVELAGEFTDSRLGGEQSVGVTSSGLEHGHHSVQLGNRLSIERLPISAVIQASGSQEWQPFAIFVHV